MKIDITSYVKNNISTSTGSVIKRETPIVVCVDGAYTVMYPVFKDGVQTEVMVKA